MEKIDTIVKALQVIRNQNNLDTGGDMILDCAVRIYITEKINKARNGKSDGATDKQKTAMKNMSIVFTDETTKEEAKKLIGDKINSFQN